MSLNQIGAELKLPVSNSTVWRAPHRNGNVIGRSSIWMDLTAWKAAPTICERTPPPSVATFLEADHSWFEVTFLPGTN
ncbi:hypothetical protein ANCDUO_09051 [Ancylostoma duodenale]|uniref:Transposable element Tc3 transposase-like DNA-binding HTH domain-containing protein n=1 Tax=Ancylostoma duodenale TaxID=51022 RepID=A0A0C2CUV4_9BILA|nr:hypothetical protein ANCDUO_09051 [Ancylostoma duodenale]